jgi:hypothetical protein
LRFLPPLTAAPFRIESAALSEKFAEQFSISLLSELLDLLLLLVPFLARHCFRLPAELRSYS